MRQLFVTHLYEAKVADHALLDELGHSIRSLARDDEAGRRWSKEHRYTGYTSYASLNDLPKRDPIFADLARMLGRHAAKFAKRRRSSSSTKPQARQPVGEPVESRWTSQWTCPPAQHPVRHLLCRSAEGIRPDPFEDPRLPLMMAAPLAQAPETFVTR